MHERTSKCKPPAGSAWGNVIRGSCKTPRVAIKQDGRSNAVSRGCGTTSASRGAAISAPAFRICHRHRGDLRPHPAAAGPELLEAGRPGFCKGLAGQSVFQAVCGDDLSEVERVKVFVGIHVCEGRIQQFRGDGGPKECFALEMKAGDVDDRSHCLLRIT